MAQNVSLYKDLEFRGLIHQVTDPELENILKDKSLTLYAGFDPTADSLHLGHLLPLMTLKRFKLRGHTPIAIVGGATGMIGDPSGKSQERNLLTEEVLEKNLKGLTLQIQHVLGVDAKVLNNNDWFKEFKYTDFLRDVGKHFTVNHMMAKESVRARLEDREHGISYTEFSYMLLQAYDFYHLFKKNNCTLQIGGSDQWGNITAGAELIRRMSAAQNVPAPHVFGLTQPLVTKADGSKFGKTESGAIWLDPSKTTPYQFYQYFMQAHDADVVMLLKYFTFLSHEELTKLEASVIAEPEKRLAQARLAEELTTLIHGADELNKAKAATSALFGTEIKDLDEKTLLSVFSEAPSTKKDKTQISAGISVVDLLAESGLCKSKGMARQDIQGGGIYLNNERISDVAVKVDASNLIAGKFIVLRKGKKTYHLISFM